MTSIARCFLLSTAVAVCVRPDPGAAQPGASSWDVTRTGLAWQVPAMEAAEIRADIVYTGSGPGERAFDLYLPAGLPAGETCAAVIFVNGVGDPPDNPVKSWQAYRDWARAVTTRGLAGILYETEGGEAPANLAAILDWMRAHGREHGIDPSRIGVFASSANVTVALPALVTAAARDLRCATIYYGSTDVDSLRTDLPVLYIKSEKDGAGLNAGIDRLWQRARENSLPWTMVVARGLPHAFDAVDVSEASRALVQQTLEFWAAHLNPLPPAPANPIERQVNARIYAGEWAEAARMLEPIHAADGGDRDVGRLLLLCYRNTQDLERGLPLAAELSARHPDRPEFRSSWGILLATAGRAAEALEQLDAAVELGARDFVTHNTLIIASLSAGRTHEAVSRGEAAAELFPNVAGIRYNLACAYARNRQEAEAMDALAAAVRAGYRDRAAIEADPDLEPLRDDPRFRELMGTLGS